MCYEVIPTEKFEKDLQFYYKKRKYRKIEKDITPILEQLEKGEFVGDEISDLELNNSTYKVRAANTDMNVGKSNGYRLIYYVIKDNKEIYLITLYSKKDDSRIPTDKQIVEWIEEYCN